MAYATENITVMLYLFVWNICSTECW